MEVIMIARKKTNRIAHSSLSNQVNISMNYSSLKEFIYIYETHVRIY